MYEEIEFELDKNAIIDSIIERQNGNLWSAVRELYQNSVDAKAENISIEITHDSIFVRDDGVGMDDERINTFFRVLGKSSKSEEDLGEFGIGITQILPFGKCVWLTQDNAIVIDRESSSKIRLRKRSQEVDGCIVVCSFYKKLDFYDKLEVEEKIKEIILPRDDINVEINKIEHKGKLEVLEEYSDEDIKVFNYRKAENIIYLGGIGVCGFESSYKYCVNITTAKKPRLIFARNEFLESDPAWNKINKRINQVEEALSLNDKQIDRTKAKQLVRKISQNRLSWEKFKSKRIVPGANDKLYTLQEIENSSKEIAFGEDNIWSDDAQNQGHIVVLEEIKDSVSSICSRIGCVGPEVEATSISRKGYHREIKFSSLNNKEKEILFILQELNDNIFNSKRRIKVGASDVADAWYDGEDIYIERGNLTKYPSKMNNLVQVYRMIIHEYCHDEEDMYQNRHGYYFYENFHKKLKNTLPTALEIIEENL